MDKTFSRRSFMAGAAAGSASLFVRPLTVFAQGAKAEFRFTQYHNQTAESSLHKRLSEMWGAVNKETGGRVEAQVFPLNNNVAGSDPAALKMLVAGEIQFFTLMGGVLGAVVPVAEIQQVPFAFKTAPHAHKVVDGPLGAYIREEMAAKGIQGFPVGAFDNGMRQITPVKKAVAVPADLQGMRMRVPAGAMFEDMFRTLGCVPVTVNSIDIYAALRDGKADAQENPLALVDLYKLYEVIKYVSMTNHMWSGFNMLANKEAWDRLPADIHASIERNLTLAVRLQREEQQKANATARTSLASHGLAFNEVDQAAFRAKMTGLYASWKKMLGTKAWSLLEAETGKLG